MACCVGWFWLVLAGSGWFCLVLAGSGWFWLVLAGSGWFWLAGSGWFRCLAQPVPKGRFSNQDLNLNSYGGKIFAISSSVYQTNKEKFLKRFMNFEMKTSKQCCCFELNEMEI